MGVKRTKSYLIIPTKEQVNIDCKPHHELSSVLIGNLPDRMDPAVLLLLFSSRIYHSGRCFLLCSHSLFFFQEKLITIRTGKCHFSSVRDTRNNFNYYDKNNLNLNAYSVRNGTDQILLESPALLRLTESDEQTGRKSQSITRGT